MAGAGARASLLSSIVNVILRPGIPGDKEVPGDLQRIAAYSGAVIVQDTAIMLEFPCCAEEPASGCEPYQQPRLRLRQRLQGARKA
jgi:hypothetical protein